MKITAIPSVNALLPAQPIEPVANAPDKIVPEAWESMHARNRARFRRLTNVLSDDQGTYTFEERLAAMQALNGMAASGELRGIDARSARLYRELTANSELAQREAAISQDEVKAVVRAIEDHSSPHDAQAAFFDTLSEEDKAVHFSLNANAIDPHGHQPYVTLEQYRQKLKTPDAAEDTLAPGSLISSTI
ncbi:hypothetical protein MMA231_00807 [Asticcacaulis sp. MM231]|uniref:hypothetical protein n=1 Tax=Asticcacaulis sp. MM231 TaxID=3157666 RepID=UPI0032D5B130